MDFHALSIPQVLSEIKAKKQGLSSNEAKKRLKEFGANQFPRSGEKVTKIGIFLEQWKSPLIIILVVAGLISGVLKEFIDMTVILITVGVNVIIGFVQEYKAGEALKKLREMVEYNAIVLRDGKEMQVKSTLVIPGDILILEAREKIVADARIIEHTGLEVNEAVLTGESEPVKKDIKKLVKDLTLGDRANMVYKSTIVTNGRARAVVVGTGLQTEIGEIASLVKETKDEKTPLQKQLSKMGKVIGLVVLLISVGLFALGMFSKSVHHGFLEMFETAVAVAVAAIPEGLVISTTVILAIGMQHILKKKSLVRKLLAAETLGSVSVICTDKTGTLTEGKMRITRLVTTKDDLNFEELKLVSTEEKERHKDALLALRIGVLCNDGVLENPEDKEDKWKFLGDTTDTAFVYAGMKVGLQKHDLDSVWMRMDEIPLTASTSIWLLCIALIMSQ